MTSPLNIHASCVAINGRGILLLGKSGAGKSELALRLMDEGARLVADDRTDLFLRGKDLMARAPASIAGLLEVRSVGIIACPFAKSAKLALVVQLGKDGPRLPRPRFYDTPLPAKPVPMIALDGHAATATAKIRAALAAFSKGLFRDSFNAALK